MVLETEAQTNFLTSLASLASLALKMVVVQTKTWEIIPPAMEAQTDFPAFPTSRASLALVTTVAQTTIQAITIQETITQEIMVMQMVGNGQ